MPVVVKYSFVYQHVQSFMQRVKAVDVTNNRSIKRHGTRKQFTTRKTNQ